MTVIPRRITAVAICVLGFVPHARGADKSPGIQLATGGKALLRVVHAAKPSERVRRAATTMADYLRRISGAKFAVEVGDGQTGIAIGRPGDFGMPSPWDAKDAAQREDYLLRSHAKGVHVLGNSDLAVYNAVWDFLYRLGHRQFFPGPVWEIVPRTAELAIAVDVREHPAFLSRDIGYGCGSWNDRLKAYFEWCARNRLGLGPDDQPMLAAGHAYDQIYADLKDEFAKHPEYLALVDGKRIARGEVKFCIGNPDLRKLVARYAADYFTRKPDAMSMSLEPSDGLGWCECDKCKALGSVTDRVVTLTNEAAAAVRARHGPRKLLSIYAYAEHSPPPNIRVDSQIVTNVATSMTMGGFSTDQLIEGWHKQGAQLGIREYYGVYPWDQDLPGGCRMADLGYLKKSIPRFYRQGARFMTAESSDNWGVAGLGYYLTARLLWDVREADKVEALAADFLDKAFGPARKPMAEFYRLIDASSKPRISSDLIGRMYRLLDEARKMTDDPAVTARLDDLILYTRYVELYRDYGYIEGKERQRNVEKLLRYTYRMRHTGMVHTLGVWRCVPHMDATIKLPANCAYDVPEGKNPWMEKTPIGRAETQQILVTGIARHHLADFTPVTFSTDLVPAAPLALPDVPAGNPGLYFRNRALFYTWGDEKPAALSLTIKPGLLYQNVGKTQVSLRRPGTTADAVVLPPDKKEHAVHLKQPASGLLQVEVTDGSAGTTLSWPAGTKWVIPIGPSEATDLHSRWTMYFYVPKGTRVVAGYADSVGDLYDGSGKKVFTFGERPDYFSVPVSADQQGKLWKFDNSLGHRILLTVPPYLSRDSRELLLPVEVVRADAAK